MVDFPYDARQQALAVLGDATLTLDERLQRLTEIVEAHLVGNRCLTARCTDAAELCQTCAAEVYGHGEHADGH